MEKNNNKRTAIYLRASYSETADGKYSILNQKERLLAFCKVQGLQIKDKHIYHDIGSGTAPIGKRAGLGKLMSAARRGEFDTVIVYKIDRLSRSLHLLLFTIKELEKNKVNLHSISEAIDTGSTQGSLMLSMATLFADAEKATIHARHRACYCDDRDCD